jgi:hypothetical protein
MRNISILFFSLAAGSALFLCSRLPDPFLTCLAWGSVLLAILLTYLIPFRLPGIAGISLLAILSIRIGSESIPIHLLLLLTAGWISLAIFIEFVDLFIFPSQGAPSEIPISNSHHPQS